MSAMSGGPSSATLRRTRLLQGCRSVLACRYSCILSILIWSDTHVSHKLSHTRYAANVLYIVSHEYLTSILNGTFPKALSGNEILWIRRKTGKQMSGKYHITSDQIRSHHIESYQIISNHIKSYQIKSNHIKSYTIRSDQIREDHIKIYQIIANHVN